MNFAGYEYLLFLAGVAAVFWASSPRIRPVILLVSSYLFYASWDWRYVLVLAATTGVTWGLARVMASAEGARRRQLMALTVALTAGSFFSFKLIGGTSIAGAGLGLGFGTVAANAAVPIGLAFYSFQVIAYVVDVYRGDVDDDVSLLHFAAYVSFFPHLLAGPIVRASRLIPQLAGNSNRPDRVRLAEGLELIFLGLFKKIAVGDPLVRVASATFGASDATTSPSSVQILLVAAIGLIGGFFDVAGYIDIARGSAKVLGIEMPHNFAQPLTRSRSWTEFWRRWQVTIMAWFRDYVYLPVRGTSRTGRSEITALFAVFLLAGAWHGLTAGWIVWGAITATLLVIEQRVRRYRVARAKRTGVPRRRLPAPVRAVGGPVYVFLCVLLSSPFAVYAAPSDALDFYGKLFGGGWGGVELSVVAFWLWGLVVLLVTDQYERFRMRREGLPQPVTLPMSLGFGVAALALVVFSGGAAQPFVYFQF